MIVLMAASCSSPPPEAAIVPFFQSLEDFINSGEEPVGISDLFLSFRNLAEAEDLVTSMVRGETLVVRGVNSQPLENTLVYMTGNNRITVHRDIYVTGNKRRALFYSLDGLQWYDMKNRKGDGIVNIDYSYPMEVLYDKKSGKMQIDIQWTAGYSPSAVPSEMVDKPIVPLQRGISFYNQREDLNNIDITNAFLKIPAGTELFFYIRFSGNLLESRIEKGDHIVEIIDDFNIYTSSTSDLKMGISRDGEKWNFNPFRFDYKLSEIFLAPSPGIMEYHRDMEIRYD